MIEDALLNFPQICLTSALGDKLTMYGRFVRHAQRGLPVPMGNTQQVLAGVEEAILWLLENEDDASLDAPLPGAPAPPPAPAASRQGPAVGVGVAGILRREEQLAAAADRYTANEICFQVLFFIVWVSYKNEGKCHF